MSSTSNLVPTNGSGVPPTPEVVGEAATATKEASAVATKDTTVKKASTSRKNPKQRAVVLPASKWMARPFSTTEADYIVGNRKNALIRPGTKNFVEASEKSFKTTMLMRLTLGIACGVTTFPQLPVEGKPKKVLYLHGEMSFPEIEERVISAVQSLSEQPTDHPIDNFYQGRDLAAHLIREDGQKAIRDLVNQVKPTILVLDPWQSFITGYDENSFKDMSQAMKFVDGLIEDFDLTVLIPIHLGKDKSKGARGHSALAGWRDTLIRLTRQKAGPVIVDVRPRWAEPPGKFKLVFRDGTVHSHAYTPQAETVRKAVEEALAFCGPLKKPFVSRDELQKKFPNMSDAAFRQMLKRAKDEGAIVLDEKNVSLPADDDTDQSD